MRECGVKQRRSKWPRAAFRRSDCRWQGGCHPKYACVPLRATVGGLRAALSRPRRCSILGVWCSPRLPDSGCVSKLPRHSHGHEGGNEGQQYMPEPSALFASWRDTVFGTGLAMARPMRAADTPPTYPPTVTEFVAPPQPETRVDGPPEFPLPPVQITVEEVVCEFRSHEPLPEGNVLMSSVCVVTPLGVVISAEVTS